MYRNSVRRFNWTVKGRDGCNYITTYWFVAETGGPRFPKFPVPEKKFILPEILWVPEASLAANFRVGVSANFRPNLVSETTAVTTGLVFGIAGCAQNHLRS